MATLDTASCLRLSKAFDLAYREASTLGVQEPDANVGDDKEGLHYLKDYVRSLPAQPSDGRHFLDSLKLGEVEHSFDTVILDFGLHRASLHLIAYWLAITAHDPEWDGILGLNVGTQNHTDLRTGNLTKALRLGGFSPGTWLKDAKRLSSELQLLMSDADAVNALETSENGRYLFSCYDAELPKPDELVESVSLRLPSASEILLSVDAFGCFLLSTSISDRSSTALFESYHRALELLPSQKNNDLAGILEILKGTSNE